jgi:hypothetical protein
MRYNLYRPRCPIRSPRLAIFLFRFYMGTRPLVVELTHRYDTRHTPLSFANPFE